MKKAIMLVGMVLLARENPFLLPDTPAPSKPPQKVKLQPQPQPPKRSAVSQKENIVADLGFAKIVHDRKRLTIHTKDPLKKAFLLPAAKKGVFDFRAARSFPTKRVALQSPFRSVTIGAHKGYYRVVVKVAPTCKPKIEATSLICR